MKPSSEQTPNLWPALTALLLLLATAHPAFGTPRLSVSTVRGFPGNTVEVPVSLRFATNDLRNVVALQADVSFVPALASVGTESGGAALQGHRLVSSQPASGVKRVLVYALNNALLSNGVVASIPFTIAPNARDNIRLELSNVVLSTADGLSVPVTVAAGAVVINPVYLRPSDGNVEGYFSGVTNDQPHVVQATTDFTNWMNITTNSPLDTFLEFMDLDATNYPFRFYRWRRDP